MADGIGRIMGGSNYGIGGYGAHHANGEQTQEPTVEPKVNNYEETQLDPTKVMDFMAKNNIYVGQVKTTAPVDLDPATKERIAGYMENFEIVYNLIIDEFGEDLAPTVAEYVMDYLIDTAA